MSAPCPSCRQDPCECRWPALRVPEACRDCRRVPCMCSQRNPAPPIRSAATRVCPNCLRVQCICYHPRPPYLVITRRQHAALTLFLAVVVGLMVWLAGSIT